MVAFPTHRGRVAGRDLEAVGGGEPSRRPSVADLCLRALGPRLVDRQGERESLAEGGPIPRGNDRDSRREGLMIVSLTDGQLHALRNLADKHAGNITAFLNIADARHLTELGLAVRTRQGWDITDAGLARLAVADGSSHDHGSTDLHLVGGEKDLPK